MAVKWVCLIVTETMKTTYRGHYNVEEHQMSSEDVANRYETRVGARPADIRQNVMWLHSAYYNEPDIKSFDRC